MIFKTSKELYAHIDANCFFVSCERVRNPGLSGKFVVVAGDIVIAASYECRKFQIKVGTPIWEAEQILGKRLIKIRPDLRYYTEISQKFMAFLATKTLSIEPFSIDEAFVRITGIPERTHGGDCEAFGTDLKAEILKRIGIPVSIGIANTRIKSKIFSDINKPFGCWIGLDDEKETELFSELPVREVPFIGKATESRLGRSVRTVEDFRCMNFFELDRLIGKNATTLWLELHGVDVWKNDPRSHPKSILRSRSFNHALTDNRHVLWQRLLENFEKAYRALILDQCELAGVSMIFRDRDFLRTGSSYEF
jgi:nucleotidyltransferase/DNA polymerase involved in DNA repair